MLKLIKEDIEVAIEKDPAARNFWEVLLLYPGVHALIGYRLAHVLWRYEFKFLARFVSFFLLKSPFFLPIFIPIPYLLKNKS